MWPGQTHDYGLWGMVAVNVPIFGAFVLGWNTRPKRAGGSVTVNGRISPRRIKG